MCGRSLFSEHSFCNDLCLLTVASSKEAAEQEASIPDQRPCFSRLEIGSNSSVEWRLIVSGALSSMAFQ